MNIQLEYREMSLLRDFLRRKRNDLFAELPLRKGINIKEAREKFDTIKNPFSDIGIINRILEKVDKIEDSIKKNLTHP